jgi:uncharacterized membrane protein YphA (DoxX/SURF4 family)
MGELKKTIVDAVGLTEEQKSRGPLSESSPVTRKIEKLDTITMWVQFVLGLFLLLGLLTRFSSLILAGFVLQIILLTPALPYAPVRPGAMGHHLYVDLNVIEFLALAVLATIPTGRWFGLDALFCRRRNRLATDEHRRRLNHGA